MPESDLHSYERGLGRGCTVLVASHVPGDQLRAAHAALDEGALEVDEERDTAPDEGAIGTAGHRSRAVIMRNHGVFTIGKDATDAVKAAVLCEDVARSTHLARQLGPLQLIPADDVTRLFDRYQNVYGQHGDSEDPADPPTAAQPAAPTTGDEQ